MAKASSQKFIARNRAPRVQIEYDVELYGAEKKIQLPFVMGVLADLSGKPVDALPPVADRKFLERRGKLHRLAADLRPCPIGAVFACPADRHLDEHRSEWRDDDGGDDRKRIAAFAAPEEKCEIAEHRDRAGKRGNDGHGQCVAVLHMGEFVRHDGGNLLIRKLL